MTKESGVPEPERPLSPSNDTVRITGDLASSFACSYFPSRASHGCTSKAEISAGMVEAAIYARALRHECLPSELLLDPAWDMLLELLHAEITGRRVTAAILWKAGAVSQASGPRWINALVHRGLCVEAACEDEPSKAIIELSRQGSETLRGYFADIIGLPVP